MGVRLDIVVTRERIFLRPPTIGTPTSINVEGTVYPMDTRLATMRF